MKGKTKQTKQILHDLKERFGEGPYEVMIAGTFDLIHPGHIHFIQEAAQFGRVVVIIARDNVVKRIKQRETVLDEKMRQSIVEGIKGVSEVVLGCENGNWYEPVLKRNPHLFLMGFNQPGDLFRFEKVIHEKGGRTIFRRSTSMEKSYSLQSSSQIRRRVIEIVNNKIQ
ncbi:hypothetical protein ENUP19_0259G0035 [Entamoeba nuttalli]|uniref:Cytidylyltransferase, putative n=2 Tax=Entamoeba nuttalli TaxID=412467 RepID=K2HD78_ENTNP|nr:cytidylyltransferase, putative [Entamoeba nuttalli P19]EKE40679.1 cytidylyltransferase, putative [Entamoeba nuttalli P19]|eukprot:XP_008856984.1 cytidylyltransferase, putative [Entamoeba nuttalli P19]